MSKVTAKDIDTLLPQTQCGLCGYKGCMPYATALANQEATINLCPPGGVEGLVALGKLLQVDPSDYILEMETKAKPPLLAVIREAECIGCTKCIQACPVDAILGGSKQMHTVIADECTGCELCVEPCPVDCIDMVVQPERDVLTKKQNSEQYRKRYNAHLTRSENLEKTTSTNHNTSLSDKQSYLASVLARVKSNKKI
jgi:electron transport complex protein RnfB